VRATSRYALDEKSHIGDALRQRRPILIPDHATWVSRYGSTPRLISGLALDDGASATVPLLVDDRTLGVLVFDFAGERVFDDDTRELIDRLGDQCAQALDRANAYVAQRRATARLARSEARLTWLAHASEILTSSLDSESTIDEIARLAVPSIATWCVIELLGPPKQLSAVRHPSAKEVTRLRELIWLAPDTLGAWLAGGLDEGTLVQRDRTGWSRTVGSPRAAELLDKLGVRSCVVAPIVVRRGIVGAITLGSSEADAFDPEDLAVAQDLAARVGTSVEQATLHGAVSQFKATVDAMLDAVFLYDPQTLRLTYVNRGAAAIAASTGEELLGVRITDLQPNTTEDAFRAQIHPLLTGAVESSTSTTTIVRSDGGQVPVSTFTQCIRLPDGSTTMILTARDIREQIDAQAQLARIARDERQRAAELGAVLEGMREGVLVVDRQGAIQLANHAALEIIGARAARYPDIGDLLSVSAQSLPPLGEMTTGRVLDIPDGRSIEWSIYPTEMRSARTDEDDARSSIVMLRDVTRQRVADQAREAFIDVLSHELRTPITTIFGYAKILQRPHHGLDVAEVIGDVEIEADRLYRIVEDLLALSRMESGLQVDGEPLLLQHIVPSVIEHEARRWPGVAFEIDLPHDLPAASGEQTYVEQVLRNLLSNAAKYGHADGEETCAVTVTGSATATEVTVTVLDRGVGIDESEARRLFDLYYRSPSTARLAAGGGIGLFVCRGLVTAMGGHIWGRRRDGGGSEFGFSLPRGDEDAEPQHPSPEDEVAVHHG
jgi:PAS domain S-box-containing protein